MSTGIKKNNPKTTRNGVLLVVVICLTFVLFRLGEFVLDRIPPYSEGKCFHIQSGNPLNDIVQFKVVKNHLLNAYSDLSASVYKVSVGARVSFEEIRALNTKEMECEK